MRYRKTEIWKSVDWITILLYLIMVIAGWFSICGASYEFDNVGLFDPSGESGDADDLDRYLTRPYFRHIDAGK